MVGRRSARWVSSVFLGINKGKDWDTTYVRMEAVYQVLESCLVLLIPCLLHSGGEDLRESRRQQESVACHMM